MKYYVFKDGKYLGADDKWTPNKNLAYAFTRNEAFAKAKQFDAEVLAY